MRDIQKHHLVFIVLTVVFSVISITIISNQKTFEVITFVDKVIESISKFLVLATIVTLALVRFRNTDRRGYAVFIAAGLIVSMVADVLIVFSFISGLALFLSAHVLYTIGISRFVRFRWYVPLITAGLLAYGVAMFLYLFTGIDGALVVPVIFYIIIILTMLWMSLASTANAALPRRFVIRVIIAATLFVISDTILALHRFEREFLSVTMEPVAVLITYYAAQLMFALTLVRHNEDDAATAAEAPTRSGAPESEQG